MNLLDISRVRSTNKRKKRIGRGESSGHGKTSCRGHKGQKARSGYSAKPYFQGGSMPLVRRVPKRGFHNIFRKQYAVVNVQDLNVFNDGETVDINILRERGMVGKIVDGFKVLGNGKLTKKLVVKAQKFTGAAREKISSAGGSVETVEWKYSRPKVGETR